MKVGINSKTQRIMKKSYALLAALAALFVISCQKEKDNEAVSTDNSKLTTITAVATEADTKAYVDDLQVKWSAGDKLAVANASDEVVEFKLTGGANSASGTFSGDLSGSTLGTYAVYPKTGNSLFGDHKVFVDYIDAWDYGKSEVPMYGVNNGSGVYSFNNIGGAIKVSYSNIPATTLGKFFKITETHTGAEAKYITGLVDISDLDSTPVIELDNHGGQVVTVNNILGDATAATVVIPLPAGTGYNFKVELYEVGETSPIPGSVKTASNKTITLGKITRFPEIAIPDSYVMFEERFTASTGNSTGFSGGAGSGTFSADNTGWSAKEDKQYGAGAAAKFGTGSVVGEATTPSISIPAAYCNQPVTLHFKAAAWKDDGTTLGITVTGATASSSSVTIGNAEWTEHDITLTALSETITIKFTPEKRFFLDDVVVFFGPSVPAERTPAGISYDSHSFNAATGGAFIAPTLNNPNGVSGIIYSTDNSDIANVDENTGAVTIGSTTGIARITATFNGDATYRPASDYYDIDVSDPINVTYWINGVKTVVAAAEDQELDTVLPANPDCGIAGYQFAGWSESTVATTDTEPTYTSATVVPAAGIELWAVFVKVTSTPVAASNVTYNSSDWTGRGQSGGGSGYEYSEGGVTFNFANAYEASGQGHIKVYGPDSKITITAERNITEITVKFSSTSNNTIGGTDFTVDGTTGTWSGTATKSVELANNSNKQARVTSFVVSLAAGSTNTYSGYTTSPVAQHTKEQRLQPLQLKSLLFH